MIKRSFFISCLLMGCLLANAQDRTPWKYYDLDRLSRQNSDAEGPYLSFIDEAFLSMGLYELKAEAEDRQQPHRRDEVYYIVKGKALLVAGSDTIAVGPGSIAYVKADVPHRFFDITADMQVLVIFSNTSASPGDPDQLDFKLNELTEKRNDSKNVWNPFLDVATMRFGLYMLPREIGGDRTLTHKVDEINIVVNGRGTFVVGEDEFEVKPGSIFYVEKGNGHYFKSLKDKSLDILILFHKQ